MRATRAALAPAARAPAGRVLVPFLVPALVGLVLGTLALWPALGPGFVLRYDMVFVPDPPIPAESGGFPRAVPSDLVVALLSSVLPGQIVQKAILLGIFVLAATGAAALVPEGHRIARLAAAIFYAWNVYLAQRLLLGQWALLLGYAGLPWAVRAVTRGGVWRTVLALLPAAVGGFQAMLVSATAVVPVAGRRAPRALLAVAVLSLPWLVPALGSSAVTDPAGVRAFAPRADGPLGTLGSLLTLGGVWNSGAAVPGQETWWSALVRLAVAVAAVTGYALLARGWPLASRAAGGVPVAGGRRGPAGGEQGAEGGGGRGSGEERDGGRPAYWAGLVVASVAGLAVACAGAFLPGAVEALVGLWPGFGPLRDGQLYLAPFALLQAVGLAAVTARLSPVIRPGMLLLPLLVLPTFAMGAFGRLVAVDYPADWSRVRSVVDADPTPGALLTLPWGAYRAFGWNGGQVVLDPAVKFFRREVVWNDGLPVGLEDGRTLLLATEDPRARRVGAVLAGSGPLSGPLAAEGISHVLIQRSNENLFRSRLSGARLIFAGQDLILYRL